MTTAATAVLYAMTKQFARILDVPLMLHPTLATGRTRNKGSDPKFGRSDHRPPELTVVAAVVATLKMIYGLDGTERLVSVSVYISDI